MLKKITLQAQIILLFLTIPHFAFALISHPTTYDSFVSVTNYANVSEAMSSGSFLYFPPGVYMLNNPIIIDRDTPLFLHGADRMKTILQPANPGPLFIVRKAPLINVAGLRIDGGTTATNRENFLFENVSPIEFELQDAFVERSILMMKGPGTFRVQGTTFNAREQVSTPIIVDHPQADFLMVGGNISPHVDTSPLPSNQLFHAWQKQGRMRIYSTGLQTALGVADFRIDTRSALGAHVIANVRSEGSLLFPSTFLFVPPSSSVVDVLLMNNSMSTPGVTNPARYVDYNAGGTVWLLGNNSIDDAGILATGNAPQATIVALGNRSYSNTNLLPIVALQKIVAGNTYSHKLLTGEVANPSVRFTGPDDSLENIPPIPISTVPIPLDRPALRAPLSGMLNAKDFGAVGDGVADDTAALQAWLNAGNTLYLPQGTYRITSTLGYSHPTYGGVVKEAGGWIAGAGSDRTFIVHDGTPKGTTFATEGMAFMTIQGITFQTAPYNPASPTQMSRANVDLEFTPGAGHATQEVMFYDTQFTGGKYGLGIGLTTNTQGSENMMIRSTFRDAKIGLGIGSYNALANLTYGSSFQNNQIAIGHGEEGYSGGTWATYHTSISGTVDKDFGIINSASGVWYAHALQSSSGKYLQTSCTGASFPIFFDQSTLTSSQNSAFNFPSGGNVMFLNSTVSGGISLQQCIAQNAVFKLNSTVSSWPPTLSGGSRSYVPTFSSPSILPPPPPPPVPVPPPPPTPSGNPSPSPTPPPAPSGGGGSSLGVMLPAPQTSVALGGVYPQTSLAPSTTTPTSTPIVVSQGITLSRTLFIRMRGTEVVLLQNYLIKRGYLEVGNNTGYFGKFTEAAVKAYQKAHGFETVGWTGPKTRAKMKEGK